MCEEVKPSRAKRERAKDPRHAEFREILQRYWEFANVGGEMPWGPGEAGQLSNLLKSSPKLDAEQFKLCLYNRHQSDGTNHARRPCEWLSKITNYAAGPLNQFNQPKSGAKSNGPLSKAEQRTNQINRDLTAVSEIARSEWLLKRLGKTLQSYPMANLDKSGMDRFTENGV